MNVCFGKKFKFIIIRDAASKLSIVWTHEYFCEIPNLTMHSLETTNLSILSMIKFLEREKLNKEITCTYEAMKTMYTCIRGHSFA